MNFSFHPCPQNFVASPSLGCPISVLPFMAWREKNLERETLESWRKFCDLAFNLTPFFLMLDPFFFLPSPTWNFVAFLLMRPAPSLLPLLVGLRKKLGRESVDFGGFGDQGGIFAFFLLKSCSIIISTLGKLHKLFFISLRFHFMGFEGFRSYSWVLVHVLASITWLAS